jgi:hypothetical protein
LDWGKEQTMKEKAKPARATLPFMALALALPLALLQATQSSQSPHVWRLRKNVCKWPATG